MQDRRSFLKSAGLVTAGLNGIPGLPDPLPDFFSELYGAVERQRKVRAENEGSTVYLGSANALEHSFEREARAGRE